MKRKRNVSFDLDFDLWLNLRDHAIRSGKTITAVLLEWIRPRLDELPSHAPAEPRDNDLCKSK